MSHYKEHAGCDTKHGLNSRALSSTEALISKHQTKWKRERWGEKTGARALPFPSSQGNGTSAQSGRD